MSNAFLSQAEIDALLSQRPEPVSEEQDPAPVKAGPPVGAKKQSAKPAHPNLDMILDIPLKVTVSLGEATKKVEDILALHLGTIVEMDKVANGAVDILVNGKLIAVGEVVVIDERFGVKVTNVVSQHERVKTIV